MHYPDLPALIADRRRTLAKGPIALILIEDDVEIASTIDHHLKAGFAQLIVFCAKDVVLQDRGGTVHRVDYDLLGDDALIQIINTVVEAAPGVWLYHGYNAEYLFYPFCEHRSVGEMISFATEERRDTFMCYVVDLYAGDLGAYPDAVSRQDAYFDRTGYYALARQDADGATMDRQMDIFGGLRWRFEEHVPQTRRRIDRVALFRAVPGLRMLPDRTFNVAEYNTYACPWHHSTTAAVCSFRTAKALRRNPGSRHEITSFRWQNTEAFNWRSQQLLDLGLMEPGQWF
ncbi:hypothetical protein [Yoonia sp.]|uniref:hypothetical protein n=1 Tax=Yoonia sp. TaxID=2212373 RepID=UPI0025FFA915|nr:hypothetical protein [Yoonia sp.]